MMKGLKLGTSTHSLDLVLSNSGFKHFLYLWLQILTLSLRTGNLTLGGNSMIFKTFFPLSIKLPNLKILTTMVDQKALIFHFLIFQATTLCKPMDNLTLL